jgi:hypothetical protein
MIFVATTADNDHAMAWYLSMEGAHLRRTIVPVTYDDLLAAPALPRATYCFADLELLALEERAEATELWDRLAAQGSRLLNHPTRTLRRYDLLRTLHDSGRNRFTVHRPTDDLSAPSPSTTGRACSSSSSATPPMRTASTASTRRSSWATRCSPAT